MSYTPDRALSMTWESGLEQLVDGLDYEDRLITQFKTSFLTSGVASLFTVLNCPEATSQTLKIIKQLRKHDIAFRIVDVEQEAEPGTLHCALSMHTGFSTFPNIYFGSKHVGGYDDLLAHVSCSESLELLQASARLA